MRKARRDVPTRTLTVSHQIGLNRLRDDAAGTVASSGGINGSRGGGFSLGDVRDDGEERSEGIHWCMCLWVDRC